MGNIQAFLQRLSSAQDALQHSQLSEALIIHHDEADGLASAALTKLALENVNLKTRLICIDKLYPEIVANIESDSRRVLVYTDIGSAHMDLLIRANKSQNLILALDHHDTVNIADTI